MSYLCGVCNSHVPPRLSQRRHIISRSVPVTKHQGSKTVMCERTEIELEIPVCASCDRLLRDGMPLWKMREIYKPKHVVTETQSERTEIEDDEFKPALIKPSAVEPPCLSIADIQTRTLALLKAKKRGAK